MLQDLCLELLYDFEFQEAFLQTCFQNNCKILKVYNNLNYQSHGFVISQELVNRHLTDIKIQL